MTTRIVAWWPCCDRKVPWWQWKWNLEEDIYIYTQYQRKDQSRICMSLIFLDGIDVYVQLHQCVIYYMLYTYQIFIHYPARYCFEVSFCSHNNSVRFEKKQTSRLKRHRIPRFNSCAVAGWEGTTRGSTQAIFGDFLEVKTSPFWGLKSATISTSIRLSIGGSPSGGDSFWQVLFGLISQ